MKIHQMMKKINIQSDNFIMEGNQFKCYGNKCEICFYKGCEWTVKITNIPKEGDYEEECVKCKFTKSILKNPESCREKRIERSKLPGTIFTNRSCVDCNYKISLMTVENYLSKVTAHRWKIAECIECGKRYDM